MDERRSTDEQLLVAITELKTSMEYIKKDIGELKDDVKELKEQMGKYVTRDEFNTYKAEIEKSKGNSNDWLKWVLTTLISIGALIVALLH